MEGDAGPRQLNPTDADDTPDESLAVSPASTTQPALEEPQDHDIDSGGAVESPRADNPSVDDPRRPTRLGRGWLVGICAALVLMAAGLGAGGYLALRSNHDSAVLAAEEVAALQAAKDCVSATQAPDTAAMTASQAKIIECSTGDFGAQAALYSGVLVDAYQAANVQVKVSDIRAAVERHNPDKSIDVLVAMRVRVTNSEAADQEQGYRLRVQMAPDAGTYKIAKLDQVTS
jgi:Mce-associated membrane protein